FHYDGSITTYPYQDIRITGDPETGFVVVDNRGVTYHFDVVETTTKNGITCGYSATDSRVNQYNSAWYLSQIESPICGAIDFTYAASNYNYEWSPNEYDNGTGVVKYACRNENLSQGRYVTSISSTNYSIDLDYSTNTRGDIPGAPRLDEIRVNNSADNARIKWYRFGYHEVQSSIGNTYFNNEYNWGGSGYDKRLFLDRINELGFSGTDSLSYRRFEYDTTPLPSRVSTGQDRWGYYNGINSNPSYVEKTKVYVKQPSGTGLGQDYVKEFGTADRSIDSTGLFTQAGSLKKIIYPTGGYSQYTYEANTYNLQNEDFSVRKNYEYYNYICGDGYECEERTEQITLMGATPSNETIEYFTINLSQTITMDYFLAGDPGCSSTSHYIKIFPENSTNPVLSIYGQANDTTETFSWGFNAGTYRVEIKVCDSENTGSSIYAGRLSMQYLHNLGSANTNELTGGLRIQRIDNCEGDGDCLTRIFEYQDQSGNSFGQLLYSTNTLDYNVDHHCGITVLPDSIVRSLDWSVVFDFANADTIITSDLPCIRDFEDSYFINDIIVRSNPQLYSWGNTHINYGTVLIKDVESSGTSAGYTELNYTSPRDFVDMMYQGYNEFDRFDQFFFDVTDTYELLEIFKTRNPSPSLADKYPPDITAYFFQGTVLPNIFPTIGKEKSRKYYDINGSLIKESENIYSMRWAGLQSFRSNSTGNELSIPRGMSVIDHSGIVEDGLPLGYYIVRYNLPTMWIGLKSSIETEYVDGRIFQNHTTYTYDTVYHVLKSSETLDSKGKEVKQETFYAFEYDPGISSIATLMGTNRHGTAISSVSYLEDDVVSSSVAAYRLEGSKPLVDYTASLVTTSPISGFSQSTNASGQITSFLPAYNYNTTLTINEYTNCGKPSEFIQKDGVSQVVIWDSSETMIIGKATNSSRDEVGFHGFDQIPEKGWVLSGDRVLGTGYSGDYYANTKLTYNSLPAGEYIVSAWANGSGSIGLDSGNWQTVSTDSSHWEYKEWIISHPGGKLTMDVTDTTVNYDDVKIYPKGALLEGYVYNSRFQLVTKSSANRDAVHYEYDDFGRLIAVYDFEKDLLQTQKYHQVELAE
ncbi:MAG TPA: hypothetical protein DHN29_18765, partial [Cytophagales bacterium]|nr:hypothetical protein [Cytophagales bacterium]